jgi:hypothetical protein
MAVSSDESEVSSNVCTNLQQQAGCKVNDTGSNDIEEQKETHMNTCSVYLAPSSVPGGGLGMFTAKPVKKGDIILPADGPSIPIIDPDDSERSKEAWVDLFSGYWWESGTLDPTVFEADKAVDFQITMGALPNSHPCLDNLGARNPEFVPYDDSLVDRDFDPGAGAFSYYMGRDSIAFKRDMHAGEEIFLQYPDQYMNYICDKYDIPKRTDYDEAGLRLSEFLNLFDGETVASDGASGIPLKWSGSDKVRSLLPQSQSDLDRILLSSNGSYERDDLTLAIAREISVKKRSVEWLQENGMCLDNILPGKSSNPQAGKGAIAQRPMKKSDIIAPASLLQITDRDALRMPAFEGEDMQLLLNYCFGRDDSSLLLCPYTNAVLLNHCSNRRPELHPCGEDMMPNAEYRWAKWEKSTDVWLKKTIEDMEIERGRGLSLEIVATRDIKEGEEVFIDYGEKWEHAWDRHLNGWEPPAPTKGEWTSAKVLNNELGPLPVAPSISEDYISTDSREVLFTGCLYQRDSYHDWDDIHEENWEDMAIDEIVAKLGTPAMDDYDIDETHHYTDGSFWPCVVLKRHHEADTNVAVEDDYYTVRIVQSHVYGQEEWGYLGLPRIITNFPRASIRHFYLPYESDLHLPNVFRHHIELKDDIFPEHWKDRVPSG